MTTSLVSSLSLPSRRDLLQSLATVGLVASTTSRQVLAEEIQQEQVYFGVGCFWHIQHEFIQAERELLGHNEHSYTSAAGYAGGTRTGEVSLNVLDGCLMAC